MLLICSELPELLGLATTVHVLKEGRLMQTFLNGTATEDAVLRAAVGVGTSADA